MAQLVPCKGVHPRVQQYYLRATPGGRIARHRGVHVRPDVGKHERMTPFSPCMMSCSESPHGMQNAASIQRRRDMPWFHSAHSPHSRPKRRRQTDGWTARWLWLRSRAPVETAEDALTGVPVETYCRASTQGAQRCIQHLACRCAPRRPHDFGPRLKGALQKHLPGNACTRRRSLS